MCCGDEDEISWRAVLTPARSSRPCRPTWACGTSGCSAGPIPVIEPGGHKRTVVGGQTSRTPKGTEGAVRINLSDKEVVMTTPHSGANRRPSGRKASSSSWTRTSSHTPQVPACAGGPAAGRIRTRPCSSGSRAAAGGSRAASGRPRPRPRTRRACTRRRGGCSPWGSRRSRPPGRGRRRARSRPARGRARSSAPRGCR